MYHNFTIIYCIYHIYCNYINLICNLVTQTSLKTQPIIMVEKVQKCIIKTPTNITISALVQPF